MGAGTTGIRGRQVSPTQHTSRATFDEAVSSLISGAPLAVDEVEVLLGARDDESDQMLALASASRDADLAADKRSRIITYSRKVFVPLTTLFRDRCHYCIFADTRSQLMKMNKPTYVSAEQVLAVAGQGTDLGCKEALLTLGNRPENRGRKLVNCSPPMYRDRLERVLAADIEFDLRNEDPAVEGIIMTAPIWHNDTALADRFHSKAGRHANN